jgi:hypothetical protein
MKIGLLIIVLALFISILNFASAADDIESAPTLEVFVMSYCPYGIQMEKGMFPVYDLLKDKANFKIKFVSFAMHGEKEEKENARQICIREETGQFWQYLRCLAEKGDSSACIEQMGLNESEINDCMENKASDYMDADKELNVKYGIQASPTDVLDGKVIDLYPRSPESIKKAVCAAFDNPPAECDKCLDKTNPSPGFGIIASAASSCEEEPEGSNNQENPVENPVNETSEEETAKEEPEKPCTVVCPTACSLEKSEDSCGKCICPPNYGFCSESGLRDSINETSVYCYKGLWQTQKENDDSCQNNFECKSNFCSENSCYDIGKQVRENTNLIQKIFDWISSLFGKNI